MTNPTIARPAWLQQVQRHWGWVTVLLVLALVAAARIRLRDLPLERDEGEYAYAGQLILQGIPPYKLAYNMKFPGTYAAYALILAVLGQTPAGIHLGVTCVTTLTALMIYWFGRRLLDEVAGVVAATAFAVLSASPSLLGLAGHATHFAAGFATAGICLLWRRRQVPSLLSTAVGGLMLGLATLMKQHAVLLCFWGLASLAAGGLRQGGLPWKEKSRSLAVYGLGAILPFGLTCLILWHQGVFERFWFWTVSYAWKYITLESAAQAPTKFLLRRVPAALSNGSLIWLVAAAGALWLVWVDDRLRGTRLQLLGFCLASFLTTCPGFQFREHYFILMLPAVAMLAGCTVSAACRHWRPGESARLAVWPACGYAVILAATIFENGNIWFRLTPVQASRALYQANPVFAEAATVAGIIRTNSAPGAPVAVLGSEPEIYFLSHRHSATGYIYAYPLMEPQPFARRMQEEMIREIESARPGYVVLIIATKSWLRKPDSDPTFFNWWSESYQTNFVLVCSAVMDPTHEAEYLWGAEATNYGKLPHGGILIYQRQRP